MFSRKLSVVQGLLLVISMEYGQGCGPAEIGHRYTIVSPARVSFDNSAGWQLSPGPTILYDSSHSNRNYYPVKYSATRSQITILNVTKHDGTGDFQHIVEGSVVYSCALPVYKRASLPTCEPVQVIGNEIRAMCTTAEVFPRAKCQFTIQKSWSDRRVITGGSNITYTSTEFQSERNEYDSSQQRGNWYYTTSCSLQNTVNGLRPGNWTVEVIMYPEQTGLSVDQGTVGQVANTLLLSIPTVDIDLNNCPKGLVGEGDTNVRNGYIKQGERASCMCTRVDAGNPPGTVGWSSTHGESFANLSQSDDSAIIQINSPDTFTCQSKTILDATLHSMTYTPKYARKKRRTMKMNGPNEVTVSVADNQLREVPNEPLNLCGYESFDLIVICAVKKSDVRPGLTLNDFRLNIPNAITALEKYLDTPEGGDYRSVNKLKVNSGGNHTLICEARNSLFQDIKQTRVVRIEARKPPSTAPVVSAWSRQNGDILVQGDDVTITCSVYEGYPSVHSVTLTCSQGPSVISKGTSTELTLNKIGPSNKSINCVCQATHVTGCYDLRGVLHLNILSVNPNKAEGDTSPMTTAEIAGTAIGSIVAILVLVAVMALIVFLKRRTKERSRNRTKDTEYDKVRRQAPLPYQNVKSVEPTYQTVNPAERAPNSGSTSQEMERKYNNQAFGDYEEPIELDVNVYNDIQDN